MRTIQTLEEALARVEDLFQKCDERDDSLLVYMRQLVAENEQLKRSLHKLRASKGIKGTTTSSMHSKLTDALRE